MAERMKPLAPCMLISGWVRMGSTWCSRVHISSMRMLTAIRFLMRASYTSANGCTLMEKMLIAADVYRVKNTVSRI